MARTPAAVVLIVPALIAGCGPSLKHVTPDSPVAGLTVQVREFELSTDPSHPPPTSGTTVAQRLVRDLQQAGVNARLASPASRADLVLEGQVTRSERGSRGLRYLAGIWTDQRTGAARFAVTGHAVRPDGTLVGEFTAKRRAGFGLFGGDGDTLLNNCMDAVAEDVADMVITGRYEDHPEDTAFRVNALWHP